MISQVMQTTQQKQVRDGAVTDIVENLLDSYVLASGSRKSVMKDFFQLVGSISTPAEDTSAYEAAIHIKEQLFQMGYNYDVGTFSLQNVLENRAGNCLGLPLLVGTILSQHGFNFQFTALTNPQDSVYAEECRLTDELNMGGYFLYHNPVLATEDKQSAILRFTCLDHLVLTFRDEKSLETTSSTHTTFPAESKRSLELNEAYSLVATELASTAMQRNDLAAAQEHAERALLLCPSNTFAWSLLMVVAKHTFDDDLYSKAKHNFDLSAGLNSRDLYSRYHLTADQTYLERALKITNHDANINTEHARTLMDSDQTEAKFLFAICSHQIAHSGFLRLSDFFTLNADHLSSLYGVSFIEKTLSSFASEQWGSLDYYLACYHVTADSSHLAEALESGCLYTPLDQLRFLAASYGTKYYDDRLVKKLNVEYRDSALFQQIYELTSL